MGMTNPLWVDVTWNAGGSTSDITLDLCSHIQNFSGLDVLMHITCTYMTREKVLESLDRVITYQCLTNSLFDRPRN
jgi:methylenetetrahydrofolate reductase (NADPH)